MVRNKVRFFIGCQPLLLLLHQLQKKSAKVLTDVHIVHPFGVQENARDQEARVVLRPTQKPRKM